MMSSRSVSSRLALGRRSHHLSWLAVRLAFKWLRQADTDEGVKPGASDSDSAELREARKRIKLLEQENEVLRRAAAYLSQANLPGKGSTRS
jgi:transposase-like protein